jgi:hypothetical protein
MGAAVDVERGLKLRQRHVNGPLDGVHLRADHSYWVLATTQL